MYEMMIEGNQTFNITISRPTGGATIAGPTSAVVTIVDNDTILSFSQASYSFSEKVGVAEITVLRTNGIRGAASVNYATADGTAKAPQKYVAVHGTLTFIDGQTNADCRYDHG